MRQLSLAEGLGAGRGERCGLLGPCMKPRGLAVVLSITTDLSLWLKRSPAPTSARFLMPPQRRFSKEVPAPVAVSSRSSRTFQAARPLDTPAWASPRNCAHVPL